MPKKILLLLCYFLFAFTIHLFAQNKHINTEDTVFYSVDWTKVKAKYANHYRPPVVKDSNRYSVEYHRIDNSLMYKGVVKPVMKEYNYSIEPSTAIYDGHFTFYWPNGQTKSDGSYSNDLKVGEWKYFYNDGKIKNTESYYENQPACYSTYYFKNGDKSYEGLSVRVAYNGDTSFKEHAQWMYYFWGKNRISMIANYHFGKLDGNIKFYDSNGNKRSEGVYKYASGLIKDGTWIHYDPSNHKIASIQKYNDNLLDSEFVVYHTPTGKLKMNGFYDNGIRTGVWREYYEGSDRLLSVITYKKSQGEALFYDSVYNDKVIFEGKMDGGKRVGVWTRYYPENGQVKSKEHYKNNMLDGEVINYDLNGSISSELSFKDGVGDGKWYYYYPDTKDTWVVMEYDNDTFTGNMNSYYPSGRPKRKALVSEDRVIKHYCYEEDGTTKECEPFLVPAAFDGDVMTYIGDNLRYPEEAKLAKLQGKVKVGFVIDEYGKVQDPFIVEGFDSRCDEEALRLVSQMPLWIPEKIEGIPMRSRKTLPIVFWLPSDGEENADVSKEK